MYELWAGTEESLGRYYDAIKKYEALSPKDFTNEAGAFIGSSDEETLSDIRLPRLLAVIGKVGILSIDGILTSRDSWYNRYAGLVAYSEVREAVVTAIAHPGIEELLVFGRTPGGTVAGLHDTYEFMKQAQKQIPMTLFTDSILASAGYWVTAPIKKKYTAADATVGSIGIVMHHMERSKMLNEAGIKVTVIRAGEYKDMGNSVEPLTKKSLAILEEQAQYLYGVFAQAVSDSLDVPYQVVDTKMGQGRTFIGAQAVEVGLMSSVSNFDMVINKINARVDKKNETHNLGGLDMTKRYALSSTHLAALQSGAKIEDLNLEELPGAPEGADTTAPEAGTEGVAPEAGTATPEPAAGEGTAGEETPAKPDESKAFTEALALLKAQLVEKDDALISAKVENRELKVKLDGIEASITGLKGIVANAICNMQVALGGSKVEGLEEKEPSDLLALHKATLEDFSKNFKIGGVSGSPSGEEKPEASAKVSRFEAATLRAVK